MVIFGKRTRCPFCLTYSALRTVMGRMGACPMRATSAAPEWISEAFDPLPRRVPSGRMPTISRRLSMRAARLMDVRSAESRLTGKAPTRERICPSRPPALSKSDSRPMRRIHCEVRAVRYMKHTSRNDVWLHTTSTPDSPWKARSFSR